MKKRTIALAFLAFVLVLVAGTLAVLRTRWAGEWICAVAARRVEAAAGLPLAFSSCRIDPLRLEVDVEGVRFGPAGAPVFTADEVGARLSPVQALGRRIHLDALRLVRPRLVAKLPGGTRGGACPPPFLASVEVRRLEVTEGAFDLTLAGGTRVAAPRIDIRSRPGAPRTGLRALVPGGRRPRVEIEAGPLAVEAGGHAVTLERARAEGEIALDLSWAEIASAEAWGEGVRLGLHGRLTDLCAPRVQGAATAEGPIAALLALAGRPDPRWQGNAKVEVRASGALRAPALSGTVALSGARWEGFEPGDARAEVRLDRDRLVVERVEVPVPGGVVRAHGTVRLARGLPVEAEADLDGIDLADVLSRLGVTGSWVSLRLSGTAKVAGTLAPPELQGTVGVDLRDLAVLTHAWNRPVRGERPVLELRRARVESAVHVDAGGLAFQRARIAAGQGVVDADAEVHFTPEGGFRVRAAGSVDLGALGHVASVPWAGRAQVEATIAASPYANPRIEARTRVEGFKFLQVDLGTASADLAWAGGPDFVLHVRNVEGVRNQTRWSGDAAVDLSRAPPQVLSSSFAAQGRQRDLFDAVMEWMPRTRLVRDAMDGDVEVNGTASGPATALDVSFDARLGAGALYGRPFDSGRAEGKVRRGDEVFFERAELRRATGVARARGAWGFTAPFPWELELSFAGFPLADLGLPGGPWTGTASGTAALAGSTEHPHVRFAANGDGVSLLGAPLGTVQAGGTITDRKLMLTASAEGAKLAAEAQLEGRMPFHAQGELAFEDAARVLPGAVPAGLKVRLEGAGEAAGELADLAAARGRLTLARLAVGYADLRVESAEPVQVEAAAGRVEVHPFTLRGPSTELSLGGARAADGALDVSASGSLDLALLGGLLQGLRKPHGQLRIEAHVSGTADAPVLVGAGHVGDAGLQLKGSSVALGALRGDLAFSQNRVLFDDVTGELNGGRVALHGEVELKRFVPVWLRVEGELDEVPVAVPASLPATLRGRVEAIGTPESTALTGRLHVLRARYTENVGLERALFELRGRPAAAPRVYDRSGEWLKLDVQLVVDGDVRVDNDVLRGGVRGELLLTGTLASPGLSGSLSMTEGSRATFRGNEFDLKQAVVTFTGRHTIEVSLDVHGEAQVRDYVVYLHLFNTLEKPQLTLTSSPALTQQDIITLLSLGFTTHDAAAGTGVGGVATAAAAQALFSASGLDEQVRRFVPRGGPLRDVSVRVTTVYSDATGLVEPRAEFESWLWQNRLRLRYQAPLSGARGQSAQAEVRLGSHTAVQYQWDNENPDVPAGDHGIDLKLRWEWNE